MQILATRDKQLIPVESNFSMMLTNQEKYELQIDKPTNSSI